MQLWMPFFSQLSKSILISFKFVLSTILPYVDVKSFNLLSFVLSLSISFGGVQFLMVFLSINFNSHLCFCKVCVFLVMVRRNVDGLRGKVSQFELSTECPVPRACHRIAGKRPCVSN